MMKTTVAAMAVLCSYAAAAPDMEKLKAQVLASQTFKDKVAAVCKNAGDTEACSAKATPLLFARLLKRSSHGSESASLVETEPAKASAPNGLNAIKARIVDSPDFKKETIAMSAVMGCSGVRKSQNCATFVQEAAFCLAFADQLGRFQNMTGVAEEKAYCENIDKKLPQLSLFLQQRKAPAPPKPNSFMQVLRRVKTRAPEDELAKEMTHDLEMNFNKIAPFGKEDTAKELQDHAAKTQDTLVDAVENAEVAEIKRAVFRALTRLRAATIKEFDTIARLETQAIDAYNDAHHYRAENPLAHLHEDEAPVETDKLKSFH